MAVTENAGNTGLPAGFGPAGGAAQGAGAVAGSAIAGSAAGADGVDKTGQIHSVVGVDVGAAFEDEVTGGFGIFDASHADVGGVGFEAGEDQRVGAGRVPRHFRNVAQSRSAGASNVGVAPVRSRRRTPVEVGASDSSVIDG